MVRRMAWALLVGAVVVACGTSTDPATFGATGASGATTTGSTSGSGGAAPLVCAPGKQEACPCVNGAQGAQACADDGTSWGECICPAVGGAGQGGAAAGGAGGATTTSSAGGSGGTGGAGGQGGATTSTTSTGSTTTTTTKPQCASPSDCPGPDNECRARTCTGGACGFDYKAKGTPLANQTAGDCSTLVCDGSGDFADEYAPGDVPSSQSDCATPTCTPQGPAFTPKADGTSCLTACGCPPCGGQPGVQCDHGQCYAGGCVAWIPVICKVGPNSYQGCDGQWYPGLYIGWAGGSCVAGSPNAVAYCAPGTACTVYQDNVKIGVGTCQQSMP